MVLSAITFPRERIFALVIGLVDGILTALILAGAKVLHSHDTIGFKLILRISLATALSGAFIFFVAEYVRLRGELVRAERHLNLMSHGYLATTRLGKIVFIEALKGMSISGFCSFIGALLPLTLGLLLPGPNWVPVAVSVVALGILGIGLAWTVYGNIFRWAVALMLSGVLLTIVGVKLHIV
jgi:predicted membrane protein (TIGR00267 family)